MSAKPFTEWARILAAECPGWVLDTTGTNSPHTWEHRKVIEIPAAESGRHGLFLHELAHAVCIERGHNPFGNKHDGLFADVFDEMVTKHTALLATLDAARAEVGETSSDGPCRENDGCPTELAVLQRFWRSHQSLSHASRAEALTKEERAFFEAACYWKECVEKFKTCSPKDRGHWGSSVRRRRTLMGTAYHAMLEARAMAQKARGA